MTGLRVTKDFKEFRFEGVWDKLECENYFQTQ